MTLYGIWCEFPKQAGGQFGWLSPVWEKGIMPYHGTARTMRELVEKFDACPLCQRTGRHGGKLAIQVIAESEVEHYMQTGQSRSGEGAATS